MVSQNSKTSMSNRPLSPHLQIYKPQITSVMSIMHRITGVVLSFGVLIFVWYLGALASGIQAYQIFTGISGSFIGVIAIAGFVVSLAYHLCNGIRHLAWDLGFGYKIETVTKSGFAVLYATAFVSLCAFIILIF